MVVLLAVYLISAEDSVSMSVEFSVTSFTFTHSPLLGLEKKQFYKEFGGLIGGLVGFP